MSDIYKFTSADRKKNFGVDTSPTEYVYARYISDNLPDRARAPELFSLTRRTGDITDFDKFAGQLESLHRKTGKKVLLSLDVHSGADELGGYISIGTPNKPNKITTPLHMLSILDKHGFNKNTLTIVSNSCDMQQVFNRSTEALIPGRQSYDKLIFTKPNQLEPKLAREKGSFNEKYLRSLVNKFDIIGGDTISYGSDALVSFIEGTGQLKYSRIRNVSHEVGREHLADRVAVPPDMAYITRQESVLHNLAVDIKRKEISKKRLHSARVINSESTDPMDYFWLDMANQAAPIVGAIGGAIAAGGVLSAASWLYNNRTIKPGAVPEVNPLLLSTRGSVARTVAYATRDISPSVFMMDIPGMSVWGSNPSMLGTVPLEKKINYSRGQGLSIYRPTPSFQPFRIEGPISIPGVEDFLIDIDNTIDTYPNIRSYTRGENLRFPAPERFRPTFTMGSGMSIVRPVNLKPPIAVAVSRATANIHPNVFRAGLAGVALAGLAAVGASLLTNRSNNLKADWQGNIMPGLSNRIDATRRGESIAVMMYDFKDTDIANRLIAASKRGVVVNMLLGKTPDSTYSSALRQAGINVNVRSKIRKDAGETEYMHGKTVAFSSGTVFSMSGNLIPQHYNNPTWGSYITNSFRGLIGKPPVGGTIDTAKIIEDMGFAKAIDKAVRFPSQADSIVTDSWMLLTPNGANNSQALDKIISMISGARSSINISSMQLTDGRILDSIVAAAGRGVKVYPTVGEAVSPAVRTRLAKSGIELRMVPEASGYYNHDKLLVVDDQRAYIGSSAMSDRTFKYNFETGTFFSGSQAAKMASIARTSYGMSIPVYNRIETMWDKDVLNTFMPRQDSDLHRVKYTVNPNLPAWIKDKAIEDGTIDQFEQSPSVGTHLYSAIYSGNNMGSLAGMSIPTSVSEFDRLVAQRTWGQTWPGMFRQVGTRGPLDSMLVRVSRNMDDYLFGPESVETDMYTGKRTNARYIENITTNLFDFGQNTTLNIANYYYLTLPLLQMRVAIRNSILSGLQTISKGDNRFGKIATYFFGENYDRVWNRLAGESIEHMLLPAAQKTDWFMQASPTTKAIMNMFYDGAETTKTGERIKRTFAQSTHEAYQMSDKWLADHPLLRIISSEGLGRYFNAYGPGYFWDQAKSLKTIRSTYRDLASDLNLSQRSALDRVINGHKQAWLWDSIPFGMGNRLAQESRSEAKTLWGILQDEIYKSGQDSAADSFEARLLKKTVEYDSAVQVLHNRRRDAFNIALGFDRETGYGTKHFNGAFLARAISIGIPLLVANRWAGELGAATRADIIDQSRFINAMNRMPHTGRMDAGMSWTPGLPWWSTYFSDKAKNQDVITRSIAGLADTPGMIFGTGWYNIQKAFAIAATMSKTKSILSESVAGPGQFAVSKLTLASRAIANPYESIRDPYSKRALIARSLLARQTGDTRAANMLLNEAVSGIGPGVSDITAKEGISIGLQLAIMPQIMTPTLGVSFFGNEGFMSLSLQGPVALQAGFTLALPLGFGYSPYGDQSDLSAFKGPLDLIGLGGISKYDFKYIKGTSGEALFDMGVDIAGVSGISYGVSSLLGRTRLGQSFMGSSVYERLQGPRTLLGIMPGLIGGGISTIASIKQHIRDHRALRAMGINENVFGDATEIRDKILRTRSIDDRIAKLVQLVGDLQGTNQLAAKNYNQLHNFVHGGPITEASIRSQFGSILHETPAGELSARRMGKLGKFGMAAAASYLLSDMFISMFGDSGYQGGAARIYKSIDEGFNLTGRNVSELIKTNTYTKIGVATATGGLAGYLLTRGFSRNFTTAGIALGALAGGVAYRATSSLIAGLAQTGLGMIGGLYGVNYKTYRNKDIYEDAAYPVNAGDPDSIDRNAADSIGFWSRHIDRFSNASRLAYGGIQNLFTGFSNLGVSIGLIKGFEDQEGNSVVFNKVSVYLDFGGAQLVLSRGLVGSKRNLNRSNILADYVVRSFVDSESPIRNTTREARAVIGKMWHSSSPVSQASSAVSVQLHRRMAETNWILNTDAASSMAHYMMGASKGGIFVAGLADLKRYMPRDNKDNPMGIWTFGYIRPGVRSHKFFKYMQEVRSNSDQTGVLPELGDEWDMESNSKAFDAGIGIEPRDYFNFVLRDWPVTRAAAAFGAAASIGVGGWLLHDFFRGAKPSSFAREGSVSRLLNSNIGSANMGYTGISPTWDNSMRSINPAGNAIYDRGAIVVGSGKQARLYAFGPNQIEHGNPLRANVSRFQGAVDMRAINNTLTYASKIRGGAGLRNLEVALSNISIASDEAVDVTRIYASQALKKVGKHISSLETALRTQAKMFKSAAFKLQNVKDPYQIQYRQKLQSGHVNTQTLLKELFGDTHNVEGFSTKVNAFSQLKTISEELDNKIKQANIISRSVGAGMITGSERAAIIQSFLQETRGPITTEQAIINLSKSIGDLTRWAPEEVASRIGLESLDRGRILNVMGKRVIVNSWLEGVITSLDVMRSGWFGTKDLWERSRIQTRDTHVKELVKHLSTAYKAAHSNIMGTSSNDLTSLYLDHLKQLEISGSPLDPNLIPDHYSAFANQTIGLASAEERANIFEAEKAKISKYTRWITHGERWAQGLNFAASIGWGLAKVPLNAAHFVLGRGMIVSGAARDLDWIYGIGEASDTTRHPDQEDRAQILSTSIIESKKTGRLVSFTIGGGMGVAFAKGAWTAGAALVEDGAMFKGAGLARSALGMGKVAIAGIRGLAAGETIALGLEGLAGGAALATSAAASGAALPALVAGAAFLLVGIGAQIAYTNLVEPHIQHVLENVASKSDRWENWLNNSTMGNFVGAAARVAQLGFRFGQAAVDMTFGKWANMAYDPGSTPVQKFIGSASELLHGFLSPLDTSGPIYNFYRPNIPGTSPSLKSAILSKSPIFYGNVGDFYGIKAREQEGLMLGDPNNIISTWFHESTMGRESDQANFSSMPQKDWKSVNGVKSIWANFKEANLISDNIGLIMRQRALDSQFLLFGLNDRGRAFGGSNKDTRLESSGYMSQPYLLAPARVFRGRSWGGNFSKAEPATSISGNMAFVGALPSNYKSIGQWDRYVAEASGVTKVDPNLIRAVMMQESQGNKMATSAVGAKGLMQFMPATYQAIRANNPQLNLSADPYDPRSSILAGALYLKDNLKAHGGDIKQALAHYNGGNAATANSKDYKGMKVWEAVQNKGYAETRDYVSKVLANYEFLNRVSVNVPTITSDVGPRNLGYGSKWHKGVDYGVAHGTSLYAASSGKVKYAGPMAGFGLVEIYEFTTNTKGRITKHEVLLGHLSEITSGVYTGANISTGQLIGKSGTRYSGPHLHLEHRIDASFFDANNYKGLQNSSHQKSIAQATFGKGIPVPTPEDHDHDIITKVMTPTDITKPNKPRQVKPVNKTNKPTKKVIVSAVPVKDKTVIDNNKISCAPKPTMPIFDPIHNSVGLDWFMGDEYNHNMDNNYSPPPQT